MRSLGIGVDRRTKLTFDDICDAIDAGRPVLVCVTTSDPDMSHWVVIYGYGRRPKLVFVAGQGLPLHRPTAGEVAGLPPASGHHRAKAWCVGKPIPGRLSAVPPPKEEVTLVT